MTKKRTDMSPLFHPRAVAVIGAGETPGKVGRIILERLVSHGRTVYPVHPKLSSLLGLATYPTVNDLPEDTDLAVIALGAEASVDVAERCAAKGIPFILPVAGGFSESGGTGAALEARLAAIPEKYASRVLGPNTIGVRSSGDDDGILDTVFIRVTDRYMAKDKGVAFISQSGSVAAGALEYAANSGFSLRALVGLGNKCDLMETDFIDYFKQDAKSACLMLYLESMDGGKPFLEQLEDFSRAKPVVLLKTGRTATAAAAVSSHTGKLAGSDNVIDGACRQFGIVRAYTETQLLDAARVLSMNPLPKGNRVGMVTSAGGYGVMASDLVETPDRGIELRMGELLPETMEKIAKATFSFVSPRNPVDITPSHTEDMLINSLDRVLADPNIDMVLVTAFFATPFMSPAIIPRLADHAGRGGKPVLVISRTGKDTEDHLFAMHAHGLTAFPTVDRAVFGLRCLVERALWLEQAPASQRSFS